MQAATMVQEKPAAAQLGKEGSQAAAKVEEKEAKDVAKAGKEAPKAASVVLLAEGERAGKATGSREVRCRR